MLENWVKVSYAGNNDEVVIVSVQGYIDTTNSPELKKVINRQVDSGRYKIIVNLDEIEYISSTGWGVFISELKEIRENNGDLVLTNMRSNVYNIYELMEFSSILKSFTDAKEAMVHFLGKIDVVEKPVMTTAQVDVEQNTGQNENKESSSISIKTDNINGQVKVEYSTVAKIEKKQKAAGSALKENISKIIYDNPGLGIKEIALALKYPEYGGKEMKKRDVKKLLKAMGLIRHSSRFNLALKGVPPAEDPD